MLEVRLEEGHLIVVNRGDAELKIARLIMEYTLRPLSYDRGEAAVEEGRRVVETIRVDRVLLPGAALRVKLRDVERVERVCVEAVGGGTECYRPAGVAEEERR